MKTDTSRVCTEPMTVRLAPEMYSAVREVGRQEGISAAGFVRMALRRALEGVRREEEEESAA